MRLVIPHHHPYNIRHSNGDHNSHQHDEHKCDDDSHVDDVDDPHIIADHLCDHDRRPRAVQLPRGG